MRVDNSVPLYCTEHVHSGMGRSQLTTISRSCADVQTTKSFSQIPAMNINCGSKCTEEFLQKMWADYFVQKC